MTRARRLAVIAMVLGLWGQGRSLQAQDQPVLSTPAPTQPPSETAPPVLRPIEKGFPTPIVAPSTPEPSPKPSLPPAAVVPPPPAASQLRAVPATSGSRTIVAPAIDASPDAVQARFHAGQGLTLRTVDGRFSLSVGLLGQFLEELHLPAAASAPNRNHLLIPIARAILSGNLFSKDFRFRLELGFSGSELGSGPLAVASSDGQQLVDSAGKPFTLATSSDVLSQSPILDFYVELSQLRDAHVRIGQTKVPFSRERLLPDGGLSFVRRSLVDQAFGFDRDIGVSVSSEDLLGQGLLRYYAGIYSAELPNSTLQSLGAGDVGLLYVGRVELTPLGATAASPRELAASAEPRLGLGLAYAFLQSDASGPYARQALGHTLGPISTLPMIDFNAHNLTADLLLQVAGLCVLTAVSYRKVAPSGIPNGARDGWGWTAQAGYLLDQQWPLELVAIYSMLRAAPHKESNLPEQNELGGGFNYYFEGHALKLQADYTHLWQRAIAGSDDNRIRVQLQVAL
ncbi:MAG TPA: hypothetical protein VF331_07035 [Polyangiales bacterium]